VVVKNPCGIWVLSSDITPLWANFTRKVPTGQISDPDRTLCVKETIWRLAKQRLSRIIPGHEPAVYADGTDHVKVTVPPVSKCRSGTEYLFRRASDNALSNRLTLLDLPSSKMRYS
jgi:hypothetical protein